MKHSSITEKDDFLATPVDIVHLLIVFQKSSRPFSHQRRLDRETAQAALAQMGPTCAIPEKEAMPSARSKEAAATARPRRERACGCGTCSWCRDNQRWERVYREKFADPTYYAPRRLRHDSTLSQF